MELEELKERIAEIEHSNWRDITQSICQKEEISPERVQQWESLWLDYNQLPEEMKQAQRVLADDIIRVVQSYIIEYKQEFEAKVKKMINNV